MSEFPLYPNAVDATDEVVVSLRAENERLTGRAELLAIEVEKQQIELTALRRPVEQSYAQDVRQYVSTKTLHEPCHSHFDVLLSVLDATARQLRERVEMLEAAQGEVQELRAADIDTQEALAKAHEQQVSDAALIARLSSPPPERTEIAQSIEEYRAQLRGEGLLSFGNGSECLEHVSALLGDCAAWRNLHALVTAERDEARRKCKTLEDESVEKQSALTNWRDTAFRMSSKHAAAERRIERLEGALERAYYHLDMGELKVSHLTDHNMIEAALAETDTPAITASQQHTAGSGDKSFTMNGCQVKHLLDLIDGEDETEVSLEWFNNARPDGNSADGEMMPPGLYAWFADYPEEGQMLLPESSAVGSSDGVADGRQRDIVAVDHEGKPVYAISDDEFRRMNPQPSATGDGVAGD